MVAQPNSGNVYVACVPHTPVIQLQESQKQASAGFWAAYDARVAEFDAFDPELVVVFGSDHYSNIHLNLTPSFMVGHAAEAIDDCGGLPGKLDVPMDLTLALSRRLMEEEFDIANSYAMKVDHGFTNMLAIFFHRKIAARPVIPVFINALAEPRPSMRRCRELGEVIGAWAGVLGKRVAFLGSGGLSHETGAIFPQYHNASNEKLRHYIVNGGSEEGIPEKKWHDDIARMMDIGSAKLVEGVGKTSVRKEWDERFLEVLASGDLAQFDSWMDADMIRDGGQGGSEVRLWLAAVAAGKAAGGKPLVVDYYSDTTTIGVGAGVVHAPAA
ncbi:MAG TPA: hypothetical protein VG943_09910 [Caulobacterales bacterium]|nr:hypothetical protein [Caulobacterales bacterium]